MDKYDRTRICSCKKRQTILKDREAILAKLQDKAQFDKHRGEDEANALLSDPAYIMYDLLPAELRHVEKIEDYVNDICYETVSHIPKAEFAEAIPQIMALRAIGVDPLEISTVVGQAGSLTELLAQKKKEKGITDTGVTLAIQAMKLELNNDRLKIMVETQRLIEEAGEMHAIRTRLAA